MNAFDLYDHPIRQDDPQMFEQFGCISSPPAIVQVVEPAPEDPWDQRYLADNYGWRLEIILEEDGSATKVDRYVSEDGAILKSALDDSPSTGSQDGISLPDKLDKIKTQLGIGMKHLAVALGVERPTAYAWVKGERLPQQKRWERIQSLLELADFWREHSRHPLSRRAFVPAESGFSVMDLMSAKTLDLPEIKDVLKKLATAENDRSALLREKAVAMRERMKAKGAKPLPDNVVDQTMRNLGGWRS